MSYLPNLRRGDLQAYHDLLAQWGGAAAALATTIAEPDWVDLGVRLFGKLRLTLETDDRAALLINVAELCVTSRGDLSDANARIDPAATARLAAGLLLGTRPGGSARFSEISNDDTATKALCACVEQGLHAATAVSAETSNPLVLHWSAIEARIGK